MRVVLDGRIVIPRMTGAGRYVVELAQRLPKLAADLSIDLLLLPAMRATGIPGKLAAVGVRIHYVNVRVASLRQWMVIPRVLQGLRPDLYHYPFLNLPYVTVPSIVTIYDLNPILHADYFTGLAGPKRFLARWLLGSTLRRCRAALAISDATRELIQQLYPQSGCKVQTIHLGVDPVAWGANGEPDSLGEAFGVQNVWQSRPYVFYVGVDRPHKNLARLVRAFARFRVMNAWQAGSGPYLRLAGVGAGPSQLRTEVFRVGIGGDVRLEGELDERGLRSAYQGASVLAYVSTSEGFGLPLLEAFAAGVPVLAADASSLPEVGGDAALYTDPYDESAMAAALGRIWSDAELRGRLIERGRQRVTEFSWHATATATLRAYDGVLGREQNTKREMPEPTELR